MVNITLYKNKAERHRVNKTNYLTEVASVTGTFTEDVSVTSPRLLLRYDIVPNFNYIFVAELHRYYFVTDYTHTANNLWEIYLEIDVLMSYKDGIYQLKGFIDRSESEYDGRIIDNKRVVVQGQDVTEVTIQNNVFDDMPPNSKSFILSGFAIDKVTQNSLSFTLASTTCYGDIGMTWEQWAESEYNTTDVVVLDNGYMGIKGFYNYGTVDAVVVNYYSELPQNKTDTISDGGRYVLRQASEV